MKLNQLEFLVALSKYGSFSRVSQELFVAQPSISVSIKTLEQELGYAILNRSNKGVSFTTEGLMVLEKAKEIMKSVEDIYKIELVSENNLQGNVSIGAESFFCSTLLLDALMEVKSKYPGPKLTISVRQDTSSELIKFVATEEMDMAVILLTDINLDESMNELKRNKLIFHELFCDEMLFIVNSKHPLLNKKLKIDELFNFRFVFYKSSLAEICLQKLQENSQKKKFDKGAIKFNDFDSIKRFVSNTDAITVLPKSVYLSDKSYHNLFSALDITDFSWNCHVGWIHCDEALMVAEKKIADALVNVAPKNNFYQ